MPIACLLALENGDLILSHYGGALSKLHIDGKVDQLMPLDSTYGTANALAADTDGSLWFAGDRGLFHRVGDTWESIGKRQGYTDGAAASVLLDQYGQLWALGKTALFRLNRQRGRFENVRLSLRTSGGALIAGANGELWIADAQRYSKVPATLAGTFAPTPSLKIARSSQGSGHFDQHGNLWSERSNGGLAYLPAAYTASAGSTINPNLGAEKNDQAWLLSGTEVLAVLEDIEGNIWVSTSAGLERFTPNKVSPVKLNGASPFLSMATDVDGHVWASDMKSGKAWRLDGTGKAVGAPSGPYSVISTAADGALLLAGPRSIESRGRSGNTLLQLPRDLSGRATDLHVMGMLDDGKILWVTTRANGLIAWTQGHWLGRDQFNLPKNLHIAVKGGLGQLWLGCTDGSFYLYDNDELRRYAAPAIGMPSGLSAGQDVIAAGELGLAVLRGHAFRLLRAFDPEVLKMITGIMRTADGDYWFNGAKGIVHVRNDDWLRNLEHPEQPLNYELINAADGYAGAAATATRLPSILHSPDGQLWFLTSRGVFRMDPTRFPMETVRAPATIVQLRAGNDRFEPANHMQLPAQAQNLSIDYTALALGRPQQVKFQYRMSGVDQSWVENGTSRTASYANIPPGSHTFMLRTYSIDGVQGDETAVVLEIAPTITQSLQFKLGCTVAALMLAWMAYDYRRKQQLARYEDRKQAQVTERERIARTLHDTFLQSVQATVYSLNAALMGLPADAAARKDLELALDQAQHAVLEGREQVCDLRRNTATSLELAVTKTANQLMAVVTGIKFAIEVHGERLPLQYQVEEEAAEVAGEALRNAFRHSRATKVSLHIAYGRRQFQLTVSDNGSGFTPHLVANGEQQQHWGMTGMRERAARIGGLLQVQSNQGTAIQLTIPARHAYTHILRSWLHRQLRRA
ncbi:hypothetical protein GTP46_08340 [Duganella sp. FT135W]|uniref:Histidine kinase/HSP90-like ATPase domain-containing protein n=1 Tax=Duganella flavida TaxID=2692175 RepID=A0A6L8K567_9BURK|nr:triple tyrosine motif-containing protein [Duganella flavida]MYM22653.1 hypothetical protein [Duganella flavida]